MPSAKKLLDINASGSYWKSARDRINDQFLVWDTDPSLDIAPAPDGKQSGVIIPSTIVMGTVTRRAVEGTWMTASNAKRNRVGSELKMQIQAPQGYKIIGADVDSQELWIASLLGDRQFQMHGSTALGFMTLQGMKALGTDLHSSTGRILGISRDHAKVFNYARIYGAGTSHATKLLLQYNPDMSLEGAKQRAVTLYTETKGSYYMSGRKPFEREFWFGGTESYMFNELERIAKSEFPLTPVLGCEIPDALRPETANHGVGIISEYSFSPLNSTQSFPFLLLSHLCSPFPLLYFRFLGFISYWLNQLHYIPITNSSCLVESTGQSNPLG